jgi:hypothetical protein
MTLAKVLTSLILGLFVYVFFKIYFCSIKDLIQGLAYANTKILPLSWVPLAQAYNPSYLAG